MYLICFHLDDLFVGLVNNVLIYKSLSYNNTKLAKIQRKNTNIFPHSDIEYSLLFIK